MRRALAKTPPGTVSDARIPQSGSPGSTGAWWSKAATPAHQYPDTSATAARPAGRERPTGRERRTRSGTGSVVRQVRHAPSLRRWGCSSGRPPEGDRPEQDEH